MILKPVHRMGDCNTADGCITTIPQSTVYVNKRLAVVDGSIGTSHDPCPAPPIHCSGVWVTAGGSITVFIEGIPVNGTGDVDTCGHARALGSLNVNVVT